MILEFREKPKKRNKKGNLDVFVVIHILDYSLIKVNAFL